MTITRTEITPLDDLAPGGQDRPGPAEVEAERRGFQRQISRVLWFVFWANILMAILKIGFGTLGFSSLFVLDGLFSAALGAYIASFMIGSQMSHERFFSRPYSYGKGKVQFLLAMLLGGLLVIGASIALGMTIKRFGHAVLVQPSSLGVIVALIATAGNLLLCYVLKRYATSAFRPGLKRLATLQALGVGTSLSVVQSVVLIGYNWIAAERIGRISISLLMLWLSLLIIRNALEGVMDQSTGEEIEGVIRDLVSTVERVEEVRWVRTRRSGQAIHVDLEVALDRRVTVAASSAVAARIKRLLASRMEQEADVINVTFCAA
jgi:cation diffusion facilitator family transporter